MLSETQTQRATAFLMDRPSVDDAEARLAWELEVYAAAEAYLIDDPLFKSEVFYLDCGIYE